MLVSFSFQFIMLFALKIINEYDKSYYNLLKAQKVFKDNNYTKFITLYNNLLTLRFNYKNLKCFSDNKINDIEKYKINNIIINTVNDNTKLIKENIKQEKHYRLDNAVALEMKDYISFDYKYKKTKIEESSVSNFKLLYNRISNNEYNIFNFYFNQLNNITLSEELKTSYLLAIYMFLL